MRTSQPRLKDKIVVITGAAGGIGSSLARRFVAEGARVALLDRDLDGVTTLADELNSGGAIPASDLAIGQQNGPSNSKQALAQVCDVTSLDDCRAAIGLVVETWGGIDILVNNAGITHLGRFHDTKVDVIRRVMEVNLFGSVNATKAALNSLLARQGQIIVTSSVAGIGDSALGTDGQPAGAGERTGVKDPMTPEEAADLVVAAALKNRRLLLIPREAKFAYWVSRLMPRLYQRLMLKRTAQSPQRR